MAGLVTVVSHGRRVASAFGRRGGNIGEVKREQCILVLVDGSAFIGTVNLL